MTLRITALAALVALGCGGSAPASPDAAPPIDAGPDAPPGVCGDGTCSPDETATSCCGDCGICADDALVTIETGATGGAPGSRVTPGGMAASYSTFTGGPFTEMAFPIAVIDEPLARAGYFWAQTFYFGTADQTGYTGLQSGSACGGGPPGKRVIFSIWDAISAAPGPEAVCEPFGGEGIGYHCCAPFNWRADVVYRLTVREVAPSQWQLTIHDPAATTDRVLGTITATSSYGRLTAGTTGFAEYFTQVASCATIPHARARLYRPSADRTPAAGVSVVTYGTCMQQASAICTGVVCQ